MSRDKSFRKSNDFREITDSDLYYDLGYKLSKSRDHVVKAANSVILYLFLTSVVLLFMFNIYQVFTLFLIIIYGASSQYFSDMMGTRERTIGLILILLANIVDHIAVGLIVLPGSIVNTRLSIFAWVFEIIWILIYGVEFLSIYAPVQQEMTPDRTVYPADVRSIKSYNGLVDRVAGSDYKLTDFEEEVDTSLLQRTFRNVVKYLIGIFIMIVIFDILIWEIISIFSGGNNVEEAYFVSGISFIIYLSIIIYSANLFGEEKTSDKTS